MMYSGLRKFIQGVPTLQTTLITFTTNMLDTPSSERADSRYPREQTQTIYVRNGKRAIKGKFGDCLLLFKYVTPIGPIIVFKLIRYICLCIFFACNGLTLFMSGPQMFYTA